MTKEEYFKSYPSSKECFQTSDGFFFHMDYEAETHARSLEDKTVLHFERDEQAADSSDNETSAKPKGLKLKAPKTKTKITNN